MKRNLVIMSILGVALIGLGGCQMLQSIADAFGGPAAVVEGAETIVKDLIPFPFNQLVHPLFVVAGLFLKGDG